MSHRPGGRSPELALMASVVARRYADWGYADWGYGVPAALVEEPL